MEPIIETVTAADGTPVITARFTPNETPKGVVLMVHGFGEHHAGYLRLGGFLCENGYAAVAFDQRGFGKNHVNSRGVLNDYALFLDDVALMREMIVKLYPGVPVHLFGHSMGGNIALNYILKRGDEGFTKLILETPWLRLYKPQPRLIAFAARVIGRISPKPAASAKLILDDISHDREIVNEVGNDEFRHNTLSLRIFTQISDAGEYALAHAKELTLPTLLICAGGDKIVSPDAIREFAQAAGGNVALYEEPDGYHALHNDSEPIKGRVLNKMLEFL